MDTLPGDEKHYQQLLHRLAPPHIREVFRAFRNRELTAGSAAAELGLGRARLYELYADYLRACAQNRGRFWVPRASGGNHRAPWPEAVEPLLRKLLGSSPPAGCSLAASELKRRLDFQLDPASVRRFAIAQGLTPDKPPRKAKASVRRWQCAKIGALVSNSTPPRTAGGRILRTCPCSTCSRTAAAAASARASTPLNRAERDSQRAEPLPEGQRRRALAKPPRLPRLPPARLPRAFRAHGLPFALYVDCHSFFLSSVPDALTQLVQALRFYDISFRYASSPQAKGKIERSHQDWQNRLPALFAAEAIADLDRANALLADLCLHRDTHERHRELAMTPLAAWLRAQKENRTVLRPAPKCPWWPCVFSLRTSLKVHPDGRIPAGSLRLRIQAPPGTRLVHCLHPNGDISILRHPPSHSAKPLLLLHLPASN